jgi:hypothetical protein
LARSSTTAFALARPTGFRERITLGIDFDEASADEDKSGQREAHTQEAYDLFFVSHGFSLS